MKSPFVTALVVSMAVRLVISQEDAIATTTNTTFDNYVECVNRQEMSSDFNKTDGFNDGIDVAIKYLANTTFDGIDENNPHQGSIIEGFQEMWNFIKRNITFQVLSGVFIMHISSLAVYFFCCHSRREAVNMPELADDIESGPFSMPPISVIDSDPVQQPFNVHESVEATTEYCAICQRLVCV